MTLDDCPMRAWNGDLNFNIEYIMENLGYPDVKEAIEKYCLNTPDHFLRKGSINECDVVQALAHAPNRRGARELEEWLTEVTLKRPLDPKPLHASREELRRQMAARSRRREEELRRQEEELRRQEEEWSQLGCCYWENMDGTREEGECWHWDKEERCWRRYTECPQRPHGWG